jgi:hypothetical protein
MPSSTVMGLNGETNPATGVGADQDPNAAVNAEQARVQDQLQPPDTQSTSSSSTGPAPTFGGVIGSQLNGNGSNDPYGIKAAQSAAQQVQPTQAQGLQGAGTMNIDPSQTSAGLLYQMMSKDSPLKQQAETQALQQMNDRGVANSSMAITAGQDAAYRAMTPLATNDSQLYADASRTNANNQTQIAGINNQAQFQAARDATLQGYNTANMGLSAAYSLQSMDAQTRNTLTQMAAQHGMNIDTMNQQQLLDLAKMAQQQGYNVDLTKLQQSNQLAQLAAQHGYNLDTMSEQQKNDLSKLAAQHANDLQNIAAQGEITKEVANINTASAQAINDTGNQYHALIQASSAAASIWSNTQSQIAGIIADKTLDAAGKQRAIDTLNYQARSGLQMIGALAGNVDIASYMDQLFGAAPTAGATPGAAAPTMSTSTGNGVVQP